MEAAVRRVKRSSLRYSGEGMNLTVHLAKAYVDDPLSLLRREPNDLLREIKVDGRLIGDLLARSTIPKPPKWADFFRSADDFDPRSLGETSSISAALLVIPEDRPFALTFGHGRSLLNLEHFEDDFGLKVALNAISQDSVKSIDKQTFDAITKQSREQASRQVDPREFGLDVEDDLLRAVVGTPSNPRMGRQLYGKESLHASGLRVELKDLHSWLRRVYSVYQETGYQEKFPWVDNIRAITAAERIQALEQELLNRLDSDDPGMIWLAAPDIIDWRRVCGFTYAQTKRKPVLYDMHLNTFRDIWGGVPTLRKLHSRQINAVDENDFIVENWPVYKCIHAEIELQDHEYLLTSGSWYQISRNFVEVVNRAVQQIPTYTGELPLFGHQGEKTEPEYNRLACASRSDLHCMDGVMLSRGGGRTPIEACDILSESHDFIHIKRYSGSSGLSHLFSQGYVSGALLATDDHFRGEFNSIVPEAFRIEFERYLRRDMCGVVFGIVSQSERELWLPFFSRLNLKNAATRLGSMGFAVLTKKIDVALDLKRLKRYVETPKVSQNDKE